MNSTTSTTDKWSSVEEFLDALEPNDPVDQIVIEIYRERPESFPAVDDLLSMAEQAHSAYDDENEPSDVLDHPPSPLYDEDRWCCNYCRRMLLMD